MRTTNLLLILFISMVSFFACKKDVPGCNDPMAANFNPDATESDGTCQYKGCTNPNAANYNPNADIDDGSCIINGCTDLEAINYNAEATDDDGTCKYRKDLYTGTYRGGSECDNPLLNDLLVGQEIVFRIVEIPNEKNKVTVEVDFQIDILEEVPEGTIDENIILRFDAEQKMVPIEILGNTQILDIKVNGEFMLDDIVMDTLSGIMTIDARLSDNPEISILLSNCDAKAVRDK